MIFPGEICAIYHKLAAKAKGFHGFPLNMAVIREVTGIQGRSLKIRGFFEEKLYNLTAIVNLWREETWTG